jgi:DNA-binding LacI/PurR family transcriptional regulator
LAVVTGATLGEVAELAGVSIATASRVLNNSAGVSVEARLQVVDAVERLAYVRHRAVRAVTRGLVRSVAAVACTNHTRFFADPSFAQMIGAATDVFAAADVPLVLVIAPDDRLSLVERYLQDGRVDGAILLGVRGEHRLAVSLPASGIPVTLIGRPLFAARSSYVDSDGWGGARLAVEHLVARGRRAIATIGGSQDTAAGTDRLGGYRDAVFEAGLLPTEAFGDFTHASGVHAMWWLLDRYPNLDAVFVAGDIMAAGALHALHQSGRRVPDDVAVVGFDDLPLAQHTQPPLTTVHQPLDLIGATAAQRLLADLDGVREDPATVLPTVLIPRAST